MLATNDYLIWNHFDAPDLPVLCLRGIDSDPVLRETTAQMMQRGPGLCGLTQVIELEGCGHAPALNLLDQRNLVAKLIDSVN